MPHPPDSVVDPATVRSASELLGLRVRRIGFYGGSFDPPHEGHLEVMEKVLLGDCVDHLCLCPHSHSPNKKGQITGISHRLRMLQCALRHSVVSGRVSICDPGFVNGLQNSAFVALTQQIESAGVATWIVKGTDSGGPDYFEALRGVPHVVVPRRDHEDRITKILSGTMVVTSPAQLCQSSRRIRQGLEAGIPHPLRAVATYIEMHGLYRQVSAAEEPYQRCAGLGE